MSRKLMEYPKRIVVVKVDLLLIFTVYLVIKKTKTVWCTQTNDCVLFCCSEDGWNDLYFIRFTLFCSVWRCCCIVASVDDTFWQESLQMQLFGFQKNNPPHPWRLGVHLCALLLLGANVNAPRLHQTPLHHAAKSMRVDMIEILVEFGANIYARDQQNKKPVDYTTPGSPAAACLRFYESE